MFIIFPAKVSDVTKIICPQCNEKVPRIGLKQDSKVDGLTFKCRRCGELWEVKSE